MRFNRPPNGHKSYNSAINGVANYVQNREFEVIPKVKDGNQFASKLGKLMRRFLKESNLKYFDNNSHKSMDLNANIIQDNFKLFKNWIETNFKS